MLPLGTSLHALAVNAAAGIRPVHGEHVRDTMARTLGVDGDVALRLRSRATPHGGIVLCPHASAAYKEWPEAHWQALIEALAARDTRPVRVCAAPGRPFLGFVQPELGLCEMADLLGGASLVIAVDSGPLHLADALGVPVVGLYAATSSLTYGPYRNRDRCIDKHAEASQSLGLRYDSARHIVHGEPMRRITVEDVLLRISAHV